MSFRYINTETWKMKETIKKKIVFAYRKSIKENYKTGDRIKFTLFLGI